MPTATIQEVAKEAGVSTSSVSRILRGGAGYTYHADTEARVRQAATRLSYQANAAARMLRSQKTKMVGLGTQVTVRPHINHLMVAVHAELRRGGYEPILFEPVQLVSSRSHAPFPSLELLAGMLCIDFSLEEQFPELCEAIYAQVPVVALYPTHCLSAASIFTNLAKGVELAVEHLAELGHQRIALAGDIEGGFHPAVPLKKQGWRNALKKHRLQVPPEYVITMNHCDTLGQMAEKAARELLQLSPAPTAVVCESDELALRVIGRLMQAGKRVPEEISVVGFDGIEFGEYSHPALTTVVQPVEKIASLAVDSLIAQIGRRSEEKISGHGGRKDGYLTRSVKTLIEPSLLVRGSTARPKSEGA